MTEEEKAEEYAEKLIEHKMANHDIFVKEKAKEEIVNVYMAGYNEAKKGFKEEIEYAEKHCLFSDCIQNENLNEAKALLKRVIEWANWQSGSKCPSFQDIEKDIKAFLE